MGGRYRLSRAARPAHRTPAGRSPGPRGARARARGRRARRECGSRRRRVCVGVALMWSISPVTSRLEGVGRPQQVGAEGDEEVAVVAARRPCRRRRAAPAPASSAPARSPCSRRTAAARRAAPAPASRVGSPSGPIATPSGSSSPSRSRSITSVAMNAEVPMSSTIGPREEGTAIAIGLVPSAGLRCRRAAPPAASCPRCGSRRGPPWRSSRRNRRCARSSRRRSTDTSAMPCAAALSIAACAA